MALSVRIPEPMRDLSSSEWKRFLQEFQIYLVATRQELESERVKIALFLNFSGSEALKLYEVKLKSENVELSEVYDCFEDFCNESASETFDRYCFYKLKQAPGQKFTDFLLLLKHQAARCNFAEEDNMIRDAILYGVSDNDLREKLLNSQELSLAEAEQECKRFETTASRFKYMAERAMMEELYTRHNSEQGVESVSGVNDYQSVSSEYQGSSLQQRVPEYQPAEYHTAQQEYQSGPEYHTVQQQEYQSVQPEYQPLPSQPRAPSYGSLPDRAPLRRTESRTFVAAPPPQRAGSPISFQPQNYPRPPPPNGYQQRVNPPVNQSQQYRPQLPVQQLQRREEPPLQNQDYQRGYVNQPEKKPLSFSPVPREAQSPQSQPQSPQNPQAPPFPRPNPQGQLVRRPNPWALLKQKLPADVRQQFIPQRRPQFDGRTMQPSDQGMAQRPPADGQPSNPNMGRGSPNPGVPGPNQGMPSPNPGIHNPNAGTLNPGLQSPSPNSMYNGRPPSGNPPPKPGMPMQRPVQQEGRESPSPHPMQGMQRVMSGERRSPYDLQRTDSMRNVDPRTMMPSPQNPNSPQGMYSPSPPRPMMDRGRDTPPGPPKTPKPPGDDDDDVVYNSPGNDPRAGMGRGQPPPMRPPSAPRPAPIPPDLNRDMNQSRPLSRTESRQSFDMRTPPMMDNREQKVAQSPLSRPMSSDLAKTPFQYRPESQNTPSPTSKPEFQNSRPQNISPQETMDRQRAPQLQNSNSLAPKLSAESRQNSRGDDSGKLTPSSGEGSRNISPQPSFELSKPEGQNLVPDRPSSVVPGISKSNDQSRSSTPSSFALKDPTSNDVVKIKSPEPTQIAISNQTKPGSDSNQIPANGLNTLEGTERSATSESGKKEVERPTSLKSSPLNRPNSVNSPDSEGRKTPLVRTPSRTSSAGQQNDAKSPLQRMSSGKRSITPKTPDGDHDSGVDESTQRKDGPTTNGDIGSPTKSPSKIPAPKKLSMPSPTKATTKASPKTPEAPTTAEKKKVPMNKIQVGSAPSPNLKTVKSKIGSLQNSTHKPGGGNVKIENRKLDWKAQPRIAAKNDTYQPGGGDKKITQVKLQWNAKPKVGSLENATHKPGGGEKKIESVKLDFKDKAKPKIGSLDNTTHKPGGGNIKTTSLDESPGLNGDIEEQKLEVKAQSKIGSLENVKHRPGGGDKKIFNDKDYLRQMSGCTSKAGSEGIPSGTQGGCNSASTSRRTSRERRCSGERRQRSESRLGRRTPECRGNAREEHRSLREKYVLQHPGEEQDLVYPLRPASSASEQARTRDSSEDRDLNSNHTTSGKSESADECHSATISGDNATREEARVRGKVVDTSSSQQTGGKSNENVDKNNRCSATTIEKNATKDDEKNRDSSSNQTTSCKFDENAEDKRKDSYTKITENNATKEESRGRDIIVDCTSSQETSSKSNDTVDNNNRSSAITIENNETKEDSRGREKLVDSSSNQATSGIKSIGNAGDNKNGSYATIIDNNATKENSKGGDKEANSSSNHSTSEKFQSAVEIKDRCPTTIHENKATIDDAREECKIVDSFVTENKPVNLNKEYIMNIKTKDQTSEAIKESSPRKSIQDQEREIEKNEKGNKTYSTTDVLVLPTKNHIFTTTVNETHIKEATKIPPVVESKEDKVKEIKEIDSKETADISKTNADVKSNPTVEVNVTDLLSSKELSQTIQIGVNQPK